MDLSLRSAIVVTIIGSFQVCAQNVGVIEHTRNKTIKVENSFIASWKDYSSDVVENQVDIFDQQGHPVSSLNVLRPVPDAKDVGIYDVSARPGSFVAVAAVYRKAGDRHLRPVPTLLLFDFNGRLSSAFALAPSREIVRLAVDNQSSIWTLTAHADNKDPSTIPLVVKYMPDGSVAKELLTRSMFPFHATATREDTSIGSADMGYDSGGLWFWLPGSTDLVTFSVEDKPTMQKTQTPRRAGHNTAAPFKIVRESSGNLVGQFHEAGEHGGSTEITNYIWSPNTGAWLQFQPGECDGGRFIGIGDKGLMYLMYKNDRSDTADICVSPQ